MKQKKGGKKGECGSGANMQRNVKDRLFRFLFEYDREALLQLYNALNGISGCNQAAGGNDRKCSLRCHEK